MQPPSTFYARYPPTMLPPNVSPYAQGPPPPPSYVYQQYPSYPPVAYTHSYTPLMHTTAPSPYTTSRSTQPYPTTAASEREAFYRKLHAFRDAIGEPIQRLPTLGFKELDLCVLYKEVIKRHGIDAVIAKKQWKEVAEALQLPSSCTDSGFRLRLHYKKYLEAFERKFYKPPVEVEVRERKKKRSSPGSESAETESGVGEESVGSMEKGSETWKERRSPVVRRKKRGVVKREKKKGDGVEMSDTTPVTEVPTEEVKQAGNGGMEGSVEMNMESGERIVPKHVKNGGEASAAGPTEASVKNDEGEQKEGEAEEYVEGETGAAEREAARALMEAKSGGIGRRGVSGGVEKRRNKVDFSVLDCATLKRYAKIHGMESRQAEEEGKKALAECVGKHFAETPLYGGETAAVLRFIQAVRRR